MKLRITVTLIACLVMTACTPVEQSARNTAAALQGAIGAAQAKYQVTCAANPKQTACTIINQAVAGQNALVTAVEAYCGWSTVNPPADGTATCTPVKSATAGLQTAINNANLFVAEIKGVL